MKTTITIMISILCACSGRSDAPPPPPTDPGPSTLPILPTDESDGESGSSSTGEEPECPWDGLCASLVDSDACGGWAVPCRDGVRCIDTEAEGQILCETGAGSSSGSGASSSGSGSSDDGVTSVAG
jgi:hypothetical protein